METTFYPMSHLPDREQDEAFSETVIVYELNSKTKEFMKDKDWRAVKHSGYQS